MPRGCVHQLAGGGLTCLRITSPRPLRSPTMRRFSALAAAVLTAATLILGAADPAAAEPAPAPPNSVIPFGNAANFGPQNAQVNAAFVGMATRPGGTGYWLTARDGAIFTYGDASFFGSTGNMHL